MSHGGLWKPNRGGSECLASKGYKDVYISQSRGKQCSIFYLIDSNRRPPAITEQPPSDMFSLLEVEGNEFNSRSAGSAALSLVRKAVR